MYKKFLRTFSILLGIAVMSLGLFGWGKGCLAHPFWYTKEQRFCGVKAKAYCTTCGQRVAKWWMREPDRELPGRNMSSIPETQKSVLSIHRSKDCRTLEQRFSDERNAQEQRDDGAAKRERRRSSSRAS